MLCWIFFPTIKKQYLVLDVRFKKTCTILGLPISIWNTSCLRSKETLKWYFLRGTAKRQWWQVRSKRTTFVSYVHMLKKWWNVNAACRGRDWQVVQKISLIKTLWIAKKYPPFSNNSWILPPVTKLPKYTILIHENAAFNWL